MEKLHGLRGSVSPGPFAGTVNDESCCVTVSDSKQKILRTSKYGDIDASWLRHNYVIIAAPKLLADEPARLSFSVVPSAASQHQLRGEASVEKIIQFKQEEDQTWFDDCQSHEPEPESLKRAENSYAPQTSVRRDTSPVKIAQHRECLPTDSSFGFDNFRKLPSQYRHTLCPHHNASGQDPVDKDMSNPVDRVNFLMHGWSSRYGISKFPASLRADTEKPSVVSFSQARTIPSLPTFETSVSDQLSGDGLDETPIPSLGSRGHPTHCGLACKYARRPRGCKDGEKCKRCHLCLWRRKSSAVEQTNHGEDRCLTDGLESHRRTSSDDVIQRSGLANPRN
eukprot:TRINITY_DN4468_c0_g1_i4.p1 TRINITY_DN4468_c0_g1~~TRINITY_DN4468_c0_g1_i4.p1  ORF type:complete len:367 (-),score=23.84 TRINITY_DN4468_c0_g1_i4:183-1196(-)